MKILNIIGAVIACPAVLLQARDVEIRKDPDMAIEFINMSNTKVHALFVGTNDFRHILDAGGWTNKVVNSLLNISEEVFELIPDIEKGTKKTDKKSSTSATMDSWIAVTKGILQLGQFVGNVLPHVAIAAISHKDYFKQVHSNLSFMTYRKNKKNKKPLSNVIGLKDVTLAIFPDDADGIAQFEKPLFVRSVNLGKYNVVVYGPEHGRADFIKINPRTGEVLRKTEKVYLPLRYDRRTESVEVPQEGENILDELIKRKREKKSEPA